MNDIVDRLRALNHPNARCSELGTMLAEAADEIERLRTDYAFADAEIRQLQALLYRCQIAWVDDDSDLAAEVRTALEGNNCPEHLPMEMIKTAIRENFKSFEAFEKAYDEWKRHSWKRNE